MLPGAGRRPLSCACHSAFLAPGQPRAPGVRRVVELLLDAGADPNETFDNEYGAMPVLYGAAGVAHDPATTRLLLDRGAEPDDGESVYHSVEAKSTECLELLLERGATVRGTNALGNAQRRPDMQRLLLERGDLRPSDPELRDALLWARGEESARLLIAHGADLEARDRDGLTPYSVAARRGDEALMAVLADAGADTERRPGRALARRGGARRRRLGAAAGRRALGTGLAARRRRAAADVRQRGPRRRRRAAARGRRAAARARGRRRHRAALRGHVGRPDTVGLLLARGAEPNLMGGPAEHPSAALGWTAWGSRNLDPEGERVEDYVAAAARADRGGSERVARMAEIAADDVAVLLEEAEPRDERVTGRPGARARALPRRPLRDRRPRLGGRGRGPPAGLARGRRARGGRARLERRRAAGACSSASRPTATSTTSSAAPPTPRSRSADAAASDA